MTGEELRNYARQYGATWGARESMLAAADEIERLTARVAELEAPQEKWPIVDVRDGYQIGACPLCGTEHAVGDAAIAQEAK